MAKIWPSKNPNRNFPENFLFGSAISPFQVEGNLDQSRRSDWDERLNQPEQNIIQPGEHQLNWWNEAEAKADLQTISQLGLNAQRLGFEWARIMPEKGSISQEAIGRYRKLVDYLHEQGLTPMVTLNHFVLPAWAAAEGGWESYSTQAAFRHYAECIADRFGDVPYWITINEPTHTAGLGYLSGTWPPGKKNILRALNVLHRLVNAHNVAFEAIKRTIPEAQVGAANTLVWLKPQRPDNFFDRNITKVMNHFYSTRFMDRTKDTSDFIGLNFYTGYYLKFNARNGRVSAKPNNLGIVSVTDTPLGEIVVPKVPYSDICWPIVPDFFLDALTRLHQTFKKPIIITENGIADRDDQFRSLYLLSHIVALHEAMVRGVDIKGYFHWSTIDNLEWLEGFRYKFGLIAYNPQTQERTLRRSAALYREIAGSNSIRVNTLAEKYLPPEQQAFLADFLSKL